MESGPETERTSGVPCGAANNKIYDNQHSTTNTKIYEKIQSPYVSAIILNI